MKKILTLTLLLSLLIPGCASIRRNQIGLGHTDQISNAVLPLGEYTSGIMGGTSWGSTLLLDSYINLDMFYGLSATLPFYKSPQRGTIFAFELSPRIRYSGWTYEPYCGILAGTAIATNRWDPQGSNWGFTLGGDLGVRKKIKNHYYTLGYRFWHESNGRRVFGHSFQENPGFNMSMIIFGIEW